ncbi:MAG TPA: sugar ABC transporter substrate-binding protein [Streptosporangiaceae bacterium]|jgi:ABC-type sugar transport system substrate-binding protein|nr:sugar ABC transporter substrate-binding protein [Streptosporangiaceae bacterium]
MRVKGRLLGTAAVAAAGILVAACGSSGTSGSTTASKSSGQVAIGIDLTYNNTAFWAAYINYEQQYATQLHIKMLGPLLAGANASLQNQQIENLVNEGAKAIVVNPETATSLGPAITYASAHHVQLVSVDTIVGVGKVYMVVRASNTLYGQDACAYISGQVKSGYVLDLEGDLTSSNGADRTNAFNSCMAANDPGVKVLKDPTVWTDATAVTDAQNAINAYGSQLKAIYSQWSSPDTGIIPLLKSKGLGPGSKSPVLLVSDDGVPFEMCDIGNGTVSASQSQPANLYAQYALTYAVDAAKGVKLAVGQPGGGAPTLQNVTYQGDTNLADPIVAPFVTKTQDALTLSSPVDGLPGSVTTTPVSDAALWGNVYGAAHGGVCSSS